MKANKKAEMTIGTIVTIILALVVLVVIIYGFTTGWSNLWQNIIGFGGGQVNVQTVVQSCQVACTTQGTYDWCTKPRSITFEGTDGKLVPVKATCNQLQKKELIGNVQLPDAGLESCSVISECTEDLAADDANPAGK